MVRFTKTIRQSKSVASFLNYEHTYGSSSQVAHEVPHDHIEATIRVLGEDPTSLARRCDTLKKLSDEVSQARHGLTLGNLRLVVSMSRKTGSNRGISIRKEIQYTRFSITRIILGG